MLLRERCSHFSQICLMMNWKKKKKFPERNQATCVKSPWEGDKDLHTRKLVNLEELLIVPYTFVLYSCGNIIINLVEIQFIIPELCRWVSSAGGLCSFLCTQSKARCGPARAPNLVGPGLGAGEGTSGSFRLLADFSSVCWLDRGLCLPVLSWESGLHSLSRNACPIVTQQQHSAPSMLRTWVLLLPHLSPSSQRTFSASTRCSEIGTMQIIQDGFSNFVISVKFPVSCGEGAKVVRVHSTYHGRKYCNNFKEKKSEILIRVTQTWHYWRFRLDDSWL